MRLRFAHRWSLMAIMLILGVFLAACGQGGESQNEPTNQGEQSAQQQDTSNQSQTNTVRIGYVTWAEDVAVTHLWKVILENEGYEVELTQADPAPIFTGIAEGDLDFFLDAWLPVTHKSYFEKYGSQMDQVGVWYEGDVKIGLVVPQYVDIDSIEELNEHSDRFNGEIVGIDPGAGLMQATRQAIEEYPLEMELLASSEAGMLSALDRAVQAQEWIVVTLWSPHWAFAKYDLKYLEDTKGFFGNPEEIYTVARLGAAEELPEVYEMFKRFKMTEEQLATLEAYIADEGLEPEAAAEKWISENQDVVASWVGE